MKNKGIVLFLAGVMCAGCFAACGEEEDGAKGDVTQEQWTAAFENVDCTNLIVTMNGLTTIDGVEETFQEITAYFNVDTSYQKSKRKELSEDEKNYDIDESEGYITEIDGVPYVYESSVSSWEKRESMSGSSSMLTSNLSVYLDYAMLGFNIAKYNAKEDVYFMEMNLNQSGAIGKIEIQFKDNSVYQLVYEATRSYKEEGKLFSVEVKVSYIFEEVTIDLPDQEGLNALLAEDVKAE